MPKEKPATKICKYCQTEIPYGAKICPQCRKKQKGGIVKWIVIAVVALAIIGTAAGGKSDNEPKKVGVTSANADSNNNLSRTEQAITENSDEGTTFKKGEIAELNNVQATLTDYKESTGSEYNKPADGKVFLLAEFEITNNTDEEIAISSMLSFEAYADDYKLDYSLGAMMEKEGNQLDGSIVAGKRMKGWIGWEVPQDYQNIEIHFTDNVWGNNKFVFVIEK